MLYQSIIKPLFDFIVALGCFLILLPIFITVAILLVFHLKGSPFFVQKRPGKNERIFKIIKFKTMKDTRGADGKLLPDDQRLTSLGRWIRSTSLDELPQLLNVIKGDMSFVGPRPLLPQYLTLYNDFQRKRHDVRPGITGWAQVNGRNIISWQEKFEFDVFYVKHTSFLMDVKILFRTFFKVMKSEGITDNKTQTVTYFTGNEE